MIEIQIRFVTSDLDEKTNTEKYKLIGYMNVKDYDTAMKTLHYMKKHEIPIEVNTENCVETDGEIHFINDEFESITFIVPNDFSKDAISPYIQVYVD